MILYTALSCYQGPSMLCFRICLSCSWVKRPCISPLQKTVAHPLPTNQGLCMISGKLI